MRLNPALRVTAFALGLFFTQIDRAAAKQPQLVTGSATIGPWAFEGDVHVMPKGNTAGSFVITLNHPLLPEYPRPLAPIVCTYGQFTDFSVQPWGTGWLATFNSTGHCVGESWFGYIAWVDFYSMNSFGILDNGEPGVGADIIGVNGNDPNPYNPYVAIGGVIDGGNFQVRSGG